MREEQISQHTSIANGEEILKVVNIRKSFGGLVALDGVSLSVKKGTVTMIIGPNGSGKTTLLNVISGFLKSDSGKVFYKGVDITNMPPHKINKLGLVRTFQIPQPFYSLTVLENLLVASRENRGEKALNAMRRSTWIKDEEKDLERAREILRVINLERVADQQSSKLSGGQLKLLEIGRALMNGAETVLMDEPAAGVAPSLAHEIFSLLRRLARERGMTFLIIEHVLEIALGYVDIAYAMAKGRVVAEGKPEEVVSNPIVIETYLGG
ncbi:MAG: ABC transporter ATP-binding protein [Fervidicoccaceae archaeon]